MLQGAAACCRGEEQIGSLLPVWPLARCVPSGVSLKKHFPSRRLDSNLNGWWGPKEPAFASSTVCWKAAHPALQQSHPLPVLSGSFHRGSSALKHISWSCLRPESGKRLVWVAWLCFAVSCSHWPHCENGTCFSSFLTLLLTTCFSASSQSLLNLSYNPWLLVGGFRIILFFTTF